MKRYIWLALLIGFVWGCAGKDPEPAFPDYLIAPGDIVGYQGSGLLDIQGGLTLHIEGAETKNSSTNTVSGITGSSDTDQTLINSTDAQPLAYKDSYTVPEQYRSNGQLRIMNAIAEGTYPMGVDGQPTPTGAIADLTLNLPGPQLYFTRTGSLTITESTLVRSTGINRLFRIKGNFQATMNGSSVGTTGQKAIEVTGSFDVLLSNR